jgi:hypothetical protein
MARLNAAIPSRSFEIIRDRILEILIDEITNQQEITYDNTSINFVLERSKNISVEEMPLINVSLDMQTLIGKCMAILENPAYKTLGFVAGFIGNVMAIDLNFAEAGKQDMKSTAMGRLQIAVKANEVTELITPALIEGYETRITLSDSNKGYKYTNT